MLRLRRPASGATHTTTGAAPTWPVWVIPTWRDPRLAQIAILALFNVLGQVALDFDVTVAQVLVALLVACVTDMALSYADRGELVLPASAAITGLSFGLLLRSPDVWPFVLAPYLSIVAKHVIRWRGEHLFNPSNIGLVAVLALPLAATRVAPGQWGTSALVLFVVLCLGLFLGHRVRRFPLVVAFVVTEATLAVAIGLFQGLGPALTLPPLATGAFALFTFFMVTDPRTTPESPHQQALFAVAVAVLDTLLRLAHVPYALFAALLVVCAARGLLLIVSVGGPAGMPWRVRTLGRRVESRLDTLDSGPVSGRRAILARAAAAAAGLGYVAAWPQVVQGGTRLAANASTRYVASGGGVNLKHMPDERGNPTVPMLETFSFDQFHAICSVQDTARRFVMATFAMGKVTIEPHEFSMVMNAASIDNFTVTVTPRGTRMCVLEGNLDCVTYAGTSSVSVGSRTVSEPAAYRIEATDSGHGGGGHIDVKTGDTFSFIAYFNKDSAPTNYSIFGPKFTFTGDMVSGRVTVRSLAELLA